MHKTISLRNFDFISLTDKGLEREKNEDYLAYFDTFNGHVFAVCDGMGGHTGGEIASKVAIEAIGEYFNADYYKNPFEAIESAIVFANKKVIEYAKLDTRLFGMGTTVILVLIRDDMIYYGHSGDSRLYILTKSQLKRLTRDHSYVNQLIDKNIITEKEAENHPRRNEITQALGLNPYLEPDVTNLAFLPEEGDVLMLCSDGLNNMVTDRSIKKILLSNKIIEQKASDLIAKALKNGGIDNISIQLIRFHNIKQNYSSDNNSFWRKIKKNKSIFKKKIYFSAIFLVLVISLYVFINRNENIIDINEPNITISLDGRVNTDSIIIYPYTIKENDSFESIAENYNTTVEQLRQLNTNITKFVKNKHLKIPIQTTYIVNEGDEIQIICQQYNISVIDIMRVNNFCNNELIIGVELIIPLPNTNTRIH